MIKHGKDENRDIGQYESGNLKMDDRFKKNGLRMTMPRRVIIGILNESSEYMSAEDVFDKLKGDYPGIGLATVYRTLNLLSSMGVVTRFEFGEGKARYELAESKEDSHHHQIVCEKCFKVINYSDFTDEECQFHSSMEKILGKKYGFDIKRHVVQYYGICGDCMK